MSKSRPVLVLIGGLAAATLVVAAGARAASSDCYSQGGQPAVNSVAFNTDYGLKPYLLGLGSSSWRGKQRIAAPPAGALCGSDGEVAAGKAALADQARFYTLLRAFPQTPTRRQWKARFGPLMQAALAADAQFLALLRAHGSSGYYGPRVAADQAWLAAHTRAPYGSSL